MQFLGELPLTQKGNAGRRCGVCIASMIVVLWAGALMSAPAKALFAVVADYFTSTVLLVPSENFTMLMPLTGAESCVPSAA